MILKSFSHHYRQNLVGIELSYKSMTKVKENYKPSVTFSALIGKTWYIYTEFKKYIYKTTLFP